LGSAGRSSAADRSDEHGGSARRPRCSAARTAQGSRAVGHHPGRTGASRRASAVPSRAGRPPDLRSAAEERLDGKYLLSTSDPDLTAEDVALGYKNLLEAERGFRDLKSTLELRPVFHRVEQRLRAHVLLCWLALLLIRVGERRTVLTSRRIKLELSRLHAVTLTGSAGTVVQTTPLTDVQAAILGIGDGWGRPADTPQWGRSHAPIKSRRSALTSTKRHNA
jgi:hypothetical protein